MDSTEWNGCQRTTTTPRTRRFSRRVFSPPRVPRARVPAPRSALSSRPRQRGAPRHLQCIRGLTGWRSIPLLRAPRPGLRRGCRRLPGRIGGRGATPTSATSPGVAASRAHAATTSVRSSNAFRVRLNGSQPVGCRAALAFFFSSTARLHDALHCLTRPPDMRGGTACRSVTYRSRPIRRPEKYPRMQTGEGSDFDVIWPRQAVLIPSQ
jgi:hypothetical protein